MQKEQPKKFSLSLSIIYFSTVVTALLVVFSVDIWVANQGDIAANEKRLSITVLDKVNALITMKMNVQEL